MKKYIAIICAFAITTPVFADGIADARIAELGTQVTIEGFVTVPSGRFTGFSFDQGFAIQDKEAGIYVSVADNPDLRLHQHIKVTGLLNSSYNQLVLSAGIEDVEVLKRKRRIRPTRMQTGSINDDTEGTPVTVKGTVTQGPIDDLPYGYKFYMDDGSGEITIFIASTVDINPFELTWLVPGQKIRVTGLSSEFDDHFEVNPRHRADLTRWRQ